MEGEDWIGMKIEGGLHTRDEFHKKSGQGKPLISIITVVRNGEKYLEQTIQSVLNQTYKNIEYIIIDGSSSDGTLDIIRKYEDRVTYWMSQPDEGIYDAMNKGSIIASGDYALYLNAGDYLYREDSIEQVIRLGLNGDEQPILIVGQVIYAEEDRLFPDWVYPTSESQIYKYNPPHQAILIGSSIYKQVFYNQLFKIAGDYAFWETLRKKNLFRVKYVNSIISVFRLGGVSNNGKQEFIKSVEHEISRYMLYGDFSVIRLINSFARVSIKKILLRIMGESRYYRYILYNTYRYRRHFLR